MPPKLGLQEQTPKLEIEGVMRAVLAPDRAAAALASVPAWPPPMTITSNGLKSPVSARGSKGLGKEGCCEPKVTRHCCVAFSSRN